jgi:glycosyltransferase involved in cell wall biosynthesis
VKEAVLLLIKGLGRGGAEQLLVSAAPYLDRSRFEYEVAHLLPWKDAFVGELQDAGLKVHCLDGARGAGWIRRLRSLVKEGGFGIVHAHSPYAAIGARLALPRRRGTGLVYTEHNVWDRYHRATYWANLVTFHRNDHVLTVSDHVRGSIRYPRPLRFFRMPPVETRYYGIDHASVARCGGANGVREELGIPDEAYVVGTVANFKVGKGHMELLEAADRVRSVVPDVRFVLVGQGVLEASVRSRAAELGLDTTVLFAGYREDATRIMGAFDVLAIPSQYDGLSIALLEAMSLGKPAVLTMAGGNPEVVEDGKQGLVVPTEDPTALADGLVALLQDPALRHSLGESARRRADDFDIRGAVRRTEDVYQELLTVSHTGRMRRSPGSVA